MRYNYGPSSTSVVVFVFSTIAVIIIMFVIIKLTNKETNVVMRDFSDSGSRRGSILDRLYAEINGGAYDDDDDDDWGSGYIGYDDKYRVDSDDDDWHTVYDYSSLFI